MAKLRGGSSDLGNFAHWLARKIRNHNPLAELDLAADVRAMKPNQYKAKTPGYVFVDSENEAVIFATSQDRTFEISVRELSDDEAANRKMKDIA